MPYLRAFGHHLPTRIVTNADLEARTGRTAASIEKVSAAHYTAAQFLLAKGDVNSAIDHYRQALNFAPENLALLLNLSVLYLRQSQFSAALDPLEHARRVAPNSADVAKLNCWAYYGLNKMDLAVAEWRRAEHLHADPEVERALCAVADHLVCRRIEAHIAQIFVIQTGQER